MIIFCDLDGTVADCSHRLGFIQPPAGGKKDWISFFDPELVAKDPPIPAALQGITRFISQPSTLLYFLTGRPERVRDVTQDWIQRHIVGETIPPVLMREDKDYRPADVYKRQHINQIRSIFPYKPMLFIDDDEKNIEMFRHYGVVLRAPGCWDHIL